MKAYSKTLFTLIFSILTVCSKGQLNEQKIRQHVLEKGNIDSVFVFGKWSKAGQTETHLKYLGQVVTKAGQTFKVLNSSWYWGISKRATSRILIFNNHNQYIGNYYLTTTTDLPTNMRNGELIFRNTDEDCDKDLITTIDLKNGLPKQFFRKCKDNDGDIYSFDKTK
jgi:hypothetical protein